MVDPRKDLRWKQTGRHITTDEVHAKDRLNNNVDTPGTCASLVAPDFIGYCLSVVTTTIIGHQVGVFLL